MRPKPIVVFLLVVVLALAGVVGYVALNPDATDAIKPTKTITDRKKIDTMVIGFIGNPFPNDYGVLKIPGYLDNNSKAKVKSARVLVQLIDEDGNKKEKIVHTVLGIPAKSRKTFEINAGSINVSRKAQISVEQLVVFE